MDWVQVLKQGGGYDAYQRHLEKLKEAARTRNDAAKTWDDSLREQGRIAQLNEMLLAVTAEERLERDRGQRPTG